MQATKTRWYAPLSAVLAVVLALGICIPTAALTAGRAYAASGELTKVEIAGLEITPNAGHSSAKSATAKSVTLPYAKGTVDIKLYADAGSTVKFDIKDQAPDNEQGITKTTAVEDGVYTSKELALGTANGKQLWVWVSKHGTEMFYRFNLTVAASPTVDTDAFKINGTGLGTVDASAGSTAQGATKPQNDGKVPNIKDFDIDLNFTNPMKGTVHYLVAKEVTTDTLPDAQLAGELKNGLITIHNVDASASAGVVYVSLTYDTLGDPTLPKSVAYYKLIAQSTQAQLLTLDLNGYVNAVKAASNPTHSDPLVLEAKAPFGDQKNSVIAKVQVSDFATPTQKVNNSHPNDGDYEEFETGNVKPSLDVSSNPLYVKVTAQDKTAKNFYKFTVKNANGIDYVVMNNVRNIETTGNGSHSSPTDVNLKLPKGSDLANIQATLGLPGLKTVYYQISTEVPSSEEAYKVNGTKVENGMLHFGNLDLSAKGAALYVYVENNQAKAFYKITAQEGTAEPVEKQGFDVSFAAGSNGEAVTGGAFTYTYKSSEIEEGNNTVTVNYTVNEGQRLDSVTVLADGKPVPYLHKAEKKAFSFEVADDAKVQVIPGYKPSEARFGTFTDVSGNMWYADVPYVVYRLGYMGGYSSPELGAAPTKFGPMDLLTREQAATIFFNLTGGTYHVDGHFNTDILTEKEFRLTFTDVEDGIDNVYRNAIAWANVKGLVKGYANTTLYGPQDNITREQVCALLARFVDKMAPAGYEFKEPGVAETLEILGDYPDGDEVSLWAKSSVAWAVKNGYFGLGDELNSQDNITRAEIAAMMARAFPEKPKINPVPYPELG